MEMVIRQSDRIACLPGHMGKGWSSDTKPHLILSFDSSVTVLRSSQAVVSAWIWIGVSFLQLGRQCSMSGKTCHVGVTSVPVHLHPVKAYAHKT